MALVRQDEERSQAGTADIKDVQVIPPRALHVKLEGEIRTWEDPESALYKTDGMIFSDIGILVIFSWRTTISTVPAITILIILWRISTLIMVLTFAP